MYTLDNIKPVDLATNVFGQNYNCTMIEMVSAFSSLVNGGNYYQPHVVKKIADDNGNTVKTIEPTLLKKTVSENTSATLKNYLQNVVANGTGKVAKVDGYSMGGQTGTAQMSDETTHLRRGQLSCIIYRLCACAGSAACLHCNRPAECTGSASQ
ncbi:MAG: penicillin-binding transpeptidase domain-containing protein [Agathobacter rectalis]